MNKVLIVFPTAWDDKHLRARPAAWLEGHEVLFTCPTDEECPSELDIVEFIERTVAEHRGRIDGVTSSSDYPGATVAAAIATELGLCASPPETRIQCSHKYYSRLAQRAVAPEATPRFALVDPGRPAAVAETVGFPCFVKPVRGSFSVFARRVDSLAELEAFLSTEPVRDFLTSYVAIFNRLVREYTGYEHDGSHFLAEELLAGHQVTVEGYSIRGRVEILGVVDSVMHPGTRSFARFDYPSALDERVQARMEDIARRLIGRIALDNSLFNVEMFYDPASDRIWIIEINPRMCGQFADLYEKVDGTNGYEIALALALGREPRFRRRQGSYPFAASVPLRIFEPATVVHAPEPEDIRAAEALFPGTRVWTECHTGQRLADFESAEDGQSCRYGIVNLGGPDRAALMEHCARVCERLNYLFEPL